VCNRQSEDGCGVLSRAFRGKGRGGASQREGSTLYALRVVYSLTVRQSVCDQVRELTSQVTIYNVDTG
jgi:hypothetical protein